VLQAVFANSVADDLVALLARTDAVSGFLASDAGRDLLAGYRRAANILRIEEKKDGPFNGTPDPALFVQPQENNLADAVTSASEAIRVNLGLENFQASMAALATLRAPLDAFFESVTVNASEPATRRNRLLLLRSVRDTMHLVADFSKIEG
jgi:glycyl-tRNA synthetase beta chain